MPPMKVIVTQTLCRAASMDSQMRRNAGSPSIKSRTRLPPRVGYEPVDTKGDEVWVVIGPSCLITEKRKLQVGQTRLDGWLDCREARRNVEVAWRRYVSYDFVWEK